jgi:hypothetical protein
MLSLLVSLKFYATVVLWVYFLTRLWQTKPLAQTQTAPPASTQPAKG